MMLGGQTATKHDIVIFIYHSMIYITIMLGGEPLPHMLLYYHSMVEIQHDYVCNTPIYSNANVLLKEPAPIYCRFQSLTLISSFNCSDAHQFNKNIISPTRPSPLSFTK